MSAAKDARGRWYCKFRYRDYAGNVIQKKKTGFNKRSEALEWEQVFLAQHQGREQLTFQQAFSKYLADCEKRLKPATVDTKKHIYKHFKKLYMMPINEISAATVRSWQNEYLLSIDPMTGKMKFTQRTIKAINTHLSSFLNWCVKFCGLPNNPVKTAGTISIKDTIEKEENIKSFWLKEDFDRFILAVKKPSHRLLFYILFYTGIRAGEAMGLRYKDFDVVNKIIHIRKNRVRNYEIGTPKTKASLRDVSLTKFLIEEFIAYKNKTYKPEDDDLIFSFSPTYLTLLFQTYIKKSGVKKIRLHDLRHSHASMLINAGFSPDVVADRLGHANASMVLQIYGHMYPQKRDEVTDTLENIYQS